MKTVVETSKLLRKYVGVYISCTIYLFTLVQNNFFSTSTSKIHARKMYFYITLVLFVSFYNACIAWERDVTCPLTCTCQLQHLTETAIYRFMQRDKSRLTPGESGSVENNEVVYDEHQDTIELIYEGHRFVIIRSATCILQTETDPLELIDLLPSNIESITLIQGYESGNKSVKFSWFSKFEKLISLELIGPSIFRKDVTNHLLCHIDYAIHNLNYLNLERVLVQNSKEQMQSFLEVLKESENITFEYIQKSDNDLHPLTIVQKSNSDEEIIPYNLFKEHRKNSGELPLFIGFNKLLLLRITNCELNNIHWEMFDGLSELQYLILERNNLRFIPSFAFYGTPNLKTLSLAHNKLLDIEITDLAGLLQLEYLDLTYNNFTQLSELSFPPFPKLKLANFANNPIGIIFPNTFEVMNTTDSLIIGSEDIPLSLLPNSFLGLNLLKTLTVHNVNVELLKRDFFVGVRKLKQLVLTGNISIIEYDTFLEVPNLETLILSNCNIYNISMDAFLGLGKVKYLDLSRNLLEYIPAGVFDHLESIKELYLNENKFRQLPRDVFAKIHPKLLRLNENPWHCSCEMSEWKPIIASRIKQKSLKPCDFVNDKGIGCASLENRFEYKYAYDTRVAPKCADPEQYKNWSVFQAMRRILKCPDYKPKIMQMGSRINKTSILVPEFQNITKQDIPAKMTKAEKLKIKARMRKTKYLNYKLKKHYLETNQLKIKDLESDSLNKNELDNTLNNNNLKASSYESHYLENNHISTVLRTKKVRKHVDKNIAKS